jgi:hypothetical protein
MPMRQGQPVRGHACGANATHDSDAAMGSRLPLPLHLRCLTCVAGGHPIAGCNSNHGSYWWTAGSEAWKGVRAALRIEKLRIDKKE